MNTILAVTNAHIVCIIIYKKRMIILHALIYTKAIITHLNVS